MSINATDRLKHILVEAEFLITISQKVKTVENLSNDEIVKRATVRSIEVIGEAVKSLPLSVRQSYPNIPWSEIARMRDNLIHRYFGINYDIVWNVAVNIAPTFKQKISLILQALYRQEYIKYKNLVNPNDNISQDYFSFLRQDILIAQSIFQEYSLQDKQFLETAKDRIIDIINQSDYVLQIKEQSDSDTVKEYINQVLKHSFLL
ncbi:MAG: HepT-like ribonuclease domain-containing protein [Waterburya sp.]